MSLEHAPQRDRARPRKVRRGRYEPLLIPILDAFEMLGVGTTKGYELVAAGVIPTVLIGRRRYATRVGLDVLSTDGTTQQRPEAHAA